MKRTVLAGLGIGSVLLVTATAPSLAQHVGAGRTGAAGDPGQACAACHGMHRPGQGVAGLRIGEGELRVVGSIAPRLGDPSLSCLRCHATATQREAAQPVEGASALMIMEGLYLGLDLSDDHPLGEIDTDRQRLPDEDILTLRSPRARRGARTLRDRWPTETIECTTCHDPHSRSGPIPPPGEEAMLCGGCHDAGTYAFGSHSGVACSGCHALHGARGSALLSEPDENRLCESCHGRGATFAPTTRERDSRLLRLLVAPRGHVLSPGGPCGDCHPAHGTTAGR